MDNIFFVGEKHSETHVQKMGEICPLAMFPESLTVDLEPKPMHIYSGVSHIVNYSLLQESVNRIIAQEGEVIPY